MAVILEIFLSSLTPAHEEREGFQIFTQSSRSDCRKPKLVSESIILTGASKWFAGGVPRDLAICAARAPPWPSGHLTDRRSVMAPCGHTPKPYL